MASKKRFKQGDKINYWNLIEYIKEEKQWLAKCVCGKKKLVWISHLTSGKSISCSCIGRSTHNMSKSKTYNSWDSAKQRCTNPNNGRYHDYGGRGIKMCDRWINSFENFLADMGEKPEGKSIDRINCDGDYEPLNCRWATNKEQSNNLRWHKYKGIDKGLRDLAKEHNIPYGRLQSRVYRGWDINKALAEPLCQGNKKQTNGQVTTLTSRNKSGIRNVYWNKKRECWSVQIKINGKILCLGNYKDIKEAEKVITNKRAELAEEINVGNNSRIDV